LAAKRGISEQFSKRGAERGPARAAETFRGKAPVPSLLRRLTLQGQARYLWDSYEAHRAR